jgi:hypothetical protein
MTLLNVPVARISSGDTAREETMPFVAEKSLVVEMDVCGGPGFDSENTEIREFVPQMRLN